MLDLGINILWFSKENYLPGNDLPEHSHKFFHYIYVLGGTAKIKVNGKAYIAKSDDFYLAHCDMNHSLEIIDTNGIQVIEIKFEIDNDRLALDVMKLETCLKFTESKVRYILEWFVDEGTKMEPYYDDLINLRFLEILIRMLRNNAKSIKSESGIGEAVFLESIGQDDDSYELDMKRVVNYIKSNLTIKLELDDLAKIANMSKYYFCRNFKRIYDVSPMKYLNRMRIERAKELMMCSDLNVSQVAYNVGFDDIHYFSRFFRQCEGVSPNEFMHKYKPNLYFFLAESEEQLGHNYLKALE